MIENGKLVIGGEKVDPETPEQEPVSQTPQPVEIDPNQISSYLRTLSGERYSDLKALLQEVDTLKASVQVPIKDDFIREAVEHYNRTGDLSAYVNAKSLNYDDMSDQEVLRRQLVRDNPALSEKSIEKLYKDKVIRFYMLDANPDELSQDDQEELEYRKELLQLEARKAREALKQEQAKMLAPPDKVEQMTKEMEAQLKEWANMVDSAGPVKDFLQRKSVRLDSGDDQFSFAIEDPSPIVEMVKDNNLFFQLFMRKNEKGEDEIDFDRFLKVAVYAKDPASFEKAILTHGKTLGTGKVLGEVVNPSIPQEGRTGQPDPGSSTVWDAFKEKLKKR